MSRGNLRFKCSGPKCFDVFRWLCDDPFPYIEPQYYWGQIFVWTDGLSVSLSVRLLVQPTVVVGQHLESQSIKVLVVKSLTLTFPRPCLPRLVKLVMYLKQWYGDTSPDLKVKITCCCVLDDLWVNFSLCYDCTQIPVWWWLWFRLMTILTLVMWIVMMMVMVLVMWIVVATLCQD